jgi:ribonucleoside-diphosphate reductase beta chain
MSLLKPRSYYKPFQYPWAYELFKKHEQMHWLPEEVEFREDIRDWNDESRLSAPEKNLLTQLFRFFTQADIDVAEGYSKIYLPSLGNHPEITMMMLSFGAREAIHVDAYSTLIETVGMPETIYQAFSEFEEMEAKHDYVSSFNADNPMELLKSLAVYSAFTEGMQLFSSFAILMNFERQNKMKGMCNIVRWSIRDESMHVEGMTHLFRELHSEYFAGRKDNFAAISQDELKDEIEVIAKTMVDLEDKFIDLCFEQGGIEGLTADEVKLYIRYIANTRWAQLGFQGELYEGLDANPLPWLDWVLNGSEHTNFFEARPTEYSKGTLTDGEGEIEW